MLRQSTKFRSVSRFYATKFGVVGAGQMGSGIAFVAAANAKYDVMLMDTSDDSIKKSHKYFDSLIVKMIQKAKITEEEGLSIKSRIKTCLNVKDLSNCDFVVEAATENTAVKLKIFKELDAVVKKECVLATNTSSISITKLASSTSRPDKVIGVHFMNPVPVMQLVEVISGLQTSLDTFTATVNVINDVQKTMCISKDAPGFIINRILMPYINEAIQVLYEGIATADDINKGMKLGTNVPMGPLELAEFIGLDTCLSIMQVLYTEFADSKYRPSPLLVKMVEAGWLGKKNGTGFANILKK
jgi:3-hydroxybutyryl-CoA dehydrogenase